ncbi:hypothetical protein ACJX0J_016355, partial [Zea mays]
MTPVILASSTFSRPSTFSRIAQEWGFFQVGASILYKLEKFFSEAVLDKPRTFWIFMFFICQKLRILDCVIDLGQSSVGYFDKYATQILEAESICPDPRFAVASHFLLGVDLPGKPCYKIFDFIGFSVGLSTFKMGNLHLR